MPKIRKNNFKFAGQDLKHRALLTPTLIPFMVIEFSKNAKTMQYFVDQAHIQAKQSPSFDHNSRQNRHSFKK